MNDRPHLRLQRDDALISGRASGLTERAYLLLYTSRGDRHFCVDRVGVSPARMGWRDATFAFFLLEQGKSDKHA